METSMDFDLNNQAEPQMVLKNDALKIKVAILDLVVSSVSVVTLVERVPTALHASDHEFELKELKELKEGNLHFFSFTRISFLKPSMVSLGFSNQK